jgi:hypothetical protein
VRRAARASSAWRPSRIARVIAVRKGIGSPLSGGVGAKFISDDALGKATPLSQKPRQ